ncbi:MAG: histidine kinase [Flavobacteriales bacterium]|nr:histidine kinase [Flavobacteriales bacterium]
MAPTRQRNPFRPPQWVLYWGTQIIGWGAYLLLFQFIPPEGERSRMTIQVVLVQWILGIGVSHGLRGLILGRRWLDKGIGYTLPRLILGSLVLGSLAFVIETALDVLIIGSLALFQWAPLEYLGRIINWTLLLSIWSFIYSAYVYFIRHRREEIRNLRLETANRENQLSTLRAQLNPHFMFNALNSIRALVDENPEQAKRSITQLSAILRNAMSSVKRKTVPLGEELDIVRAYLALEAIRYEERLRTRFFLEEGLDRVPIPPMLLQTLVENAVRHGVAKLPRGGDLHIGVHRGRDHVILTVSNSGHYEPGKVNGTGIGLRNTRRRLELIYGSDAHIRIENRNGLVVTEVEIPTKPSASAAT